MTKIKQNQNLGISSGLERFFNHERDKSVNLEVNHKQLLSLCLKARHLSVSYALIHERFDLLV